MNCPGCFAPRSEEQTVCYSCGRPLGQPAPTKTPLAVRLAALCLLIGMVGCTIVYPPYSPVRGFDLDRALLAGAVAGVCAGLGLAVGALVSADLTD